MRKLLFCTAIAAVLTASPAAAQSRGALADMDADQAARLLSSPVVQAGLADVIEQFADAFLDTRVGPLAMLSDPRDDVRSDDTLGDVLRREDPDFDRRLRSGARRSVALAGGTARGAVEMNRELRRTTERLRRVLDGAGGY